VNLRLIFLTLPILPSHVSSPHSSYIRRVISFILYCIVLYCIVCVLLKRTDDDENFDRKCGSGIRQVEGMIRNKKPYHMIITTVAKCAAHTFNISSEIL